MLKVLDLRCWMQNHNLSVVQVLQCHFSSKRGRKRTGDSYMQYDVPDKPLKLAYSSYENLTRNPSIPPVLIMHGLFSSKHCWRNTSKAIHAKTNPTRMVITLDARNHGDSPHSSYHRYIDLAEDVHLFCKDHEIPKVVIIGHSMGGRAMMVFALKYPHLVEKAIIVDISPVTSSSTLRGLGSILNVVRSIHFPDDIDLQEAKRIANKRIKLFCADKDTRNEILMNLYKSVNDGRIKWRNNVDALDDNFSHICDFPGPYQLAFKQQYRNPILFIGGLKSDFLTAPNELRRIREVFPQAKLTFLETGHKMYVEAPNEFVELVTNFINN